MFLTVLKSQLFMKKKTVFNKERVLKKPSLLREILAKLREIKIQ